MKEKIGWPIIFLLALVLTRVPGLLPENFSAVYAVFFCAGVYLPQRMAWWFPLLAMAVTDLALNLYYQVHRNVDAFAPDALLYLAGNYAAYVAILLLGRALKGFADRSPTKGRNWLRTVGSLTVLIGGGMLGAVLFYLITNTLSWWLNPFANPEYTRDLAGWIRALTTGTSGWPHTWEFFRNTLLSGGLFTGLFASAMKLSESREPQEQEAEESEPATEGNAPHPEQAKGEAR